jgi:hypothetical protein
MDYGEIWQCWAPAEGRLNVRVIYLNGFKGCLLEDVNCDVMSCSLLDIHRRFGGKYCLHIQRRHIAEYCI